MAEHKKNEYRLLQEPTRKFFKSKYGCEFTKTNFNLRGGELDVVGYNNIDKEFYIAECKLSRNATDVGKTFGQILTYISLLYSKSEEFLDKIKNETKAIKLDDFRTIFQDKEIRVKFFVVFVKENRDKYGNLIDFIVNSFKSEIKIGVIFVGLNKPVTYKNAESYFIPVIKKYSRKKFLKELGIKLERGRIINGLNIKQHENRLIKFYQGNIHFEVWFKNKNAKTGKYYIEIALHMESGKDRNNRIYNKLIQKQKLIKRKLPNTVFKEKWGRTKSSKKIFELIEWSGKVEDLNEEIFNCAVDKISLYITVLKPILDEINWGKKRG